MVDWRWRADQTGHHFNPQLFSKQLLCDKNFQQHKRILAHSSQPVGSCSPTDPSTP